MIFPKYRSITIAACMAIGSITGNPLDATISFTDVTTGAGITHEHYHATPPPAVGDLKREYQFQTGGAVAEDFDGDGWIDLYVLQGGASPNLLYMNNRDGTFREEATTRGAGLTGLHMGASVADYDNDGDIDIIISQLTAPHPILINDGSGNFTVDTATLQHPASFASSPSFGDFDNDGLLDLALGSWEPSATLETYIQRSPGSLERLQSISMNWVFQGHFADFDNDRYADLVAIADFGNTRFFWNQQNTLFLLADTSDVENGMGTATGDIDNDGDLDWFITSIYDTNGAEANWGTTGNRLLQNDGSGSFSDITTSSGVRDGAWGWGATLADFDNDGDLDIYHVNGWPETTSPADPSEFTVTSAVLYENTGGNVFQEIAAAGFAGDADDSGQGRCTLAFDYDNDGDQDLFVANNSTMDFVDGSYVYNRGQPLLLRNDSPARNWMQVVLSGTGQPHHRDGIGARVYLTTGSTTQMRELNASSGYNGHGPNRIAHFGMGANSVADTVRARWTNGDETIMGSVTSNQQVILTSPTATASERDIEPGDQITFQIGSEYIPEGGSAVWSYAGKSFGNPAEIVFLDPGEHQIRVDIYTSGAPGTIVRSEIITIKVADTATIAKSVARLWNEQNLAAIRIDFPDPTVHARNLFHTSVAMWDAWAAYSPGSTGYLNFDDVTAPNIEAAQAEAISYAAYRILHARYSGSVNGSTTTASLDLLMEQLGYDKNYTATSGTGPADLGNRVAERVLNYFVNDGYGDTTAFLGSEYATVNDPLPVGGTGTTLVDPNRWQPLLFEEATTQNGQVADVVQTFLGANWGAVRPFAHASLPEGEVLHIDPGAPPQLGGAGDTEYKTGNLSVIWHSSILDPALGATIDISPGAYGNNTLGENDGTGHTLNPATGAPYPPNVVKLADFGRVLAEFWADGPDSETPPGHWNVLANKMADHPDFELRFMGTGPVMPRLEWDVKMYFLMNGALHDAAVAAWGCKRIYDYIRPVSSIRYMGGLGQSSEAGGPSYHPDGLPLQEGLVEVITVESAASGARHDHLAAHIGKIAIFAWVGVDGIDPETEAAGCDWILAEDWLPYQRDTFVTPAFAGYVSGHSTFSRAAAEVLTRLTGSPFFPGGMATFTAHQDEFLEFENGPSTDVTLQWATFYDAADQAGVSRLYGGIHVPVDDGPGRIMGSICGIAAWDLGIQYFDGSIEHEAFFADISPTDSSTLEVTWESRRGAHYQVLSGDDLESMTGSTAWTRAEETTGRLEIDPAENPSDRMFYKVMRDFSNQ